MSELTEWLANHGINSPKVLDALTTLGGVTHPKELLLLEDDDFKELASEGGFTLLEKRKLINAVKQMRLEANPPPPTPPSNDDDEKRMEIVPSPPQQQQQQNATTAAVGQPSQSPVIPQFFQAANPQQQQQLMPSNVQGNLPPQQQQSSSSSASPFLLQQLFALAAQQSGGEESGPPNSNSTGIPGRLDCAKCNGNFPEQEGELFEGTWYCGRCYKEVTEEHSRTNNDNNESGDAAAAAATDDPREELSPELRLLAALLGAASEAGGGGGPPSGGPETGAGRVDSDTFRVTRDNVINVFQALNLEITRTFSPQLFQFENPFGKVFCRVDNNETSKCIIQTYAYFQSDISKRIDKIKFAMQWNLKHAFTKLNVDKDEDFCMESDFVLPQPSSGLLPTRGDMKELIVFWNDVWCQSIITFHMEARQFAASLRGE